MLGLGAIGELAICELSAEDSELPADAIAEIVSDSVRDLVYIVEIYAFQNT